MLNKIKNTRLYLGPMTKNIVDGVISYVNRVGESIGLIASRRQIDNKGGYVNSWDTETFIQYVKDRNKDILVCRDHGGVGQGSVQDDGLDSLFCDASHMVDIIHIDPWKKFDIEDSINYTIEAIKKCSSINNSCLFEIGTEESIFPINPELLDYVIRAIKDKLPDLFSRIVYAVIQSGTSLKAGINTGNYKKDKLIDMINICSKHGLLSKEHNGDYLEPVQIINKLNLGLSAINIAPEVAHIETEHILNNISNDVISSWFNLCLKDGQWRKWFVDDFNPEDDKRRVLKLCGHYVLSHKDFSNIFDLNSISSDVVRDVSNFIQKRSVTNG